MSTIYKYLKKRKMVVDFSQFHIGNIKIFLLFFTIQFVFFPTMSQIRKINKPNPKWSTSSPKTFNIKTGKSSFGSVFKNKKLPFSFDYLNRRFLNALVGMLSDNLDDTESSIFSWLEGVAKSDMR